MKALREHIKTVKKIKDEDQPLDDDIPDFLDFHYDEIRKLGKERYEEEKE